MLKVSLTQSECWLGRAGAPCQRVQTQRSGGSPVRRRGALLVSVRFLSQSTTRTDRQTSTQTHTHTVFRCVRRVSGSSADLRCVPCFTPSLPGKHGRSSVPDPLLSHAEHTPSGWTCPRSPTAAAGCCAPTAACTPRRLTHTLTRGFVCASAAPTFIVRQETNPRVLTPALFPLKSPPTPLHREPGRHSLTGDDWHWTNTHRYVQVFSTARFISTGVTCWISSTSPPLQITLNKQLNLRSTSAASAPSGHFPSRFSMDKTRNFCN